VVTDYEDLSKVKLIDFGLATKSTKVRDFAKCGTLLYTPPEQILQNFAYAKKADMWAAGIITYQLLFGSHPLDNNCSKQELKAKLREYQ
jgi:serine/threonine protein kinase